MKSVQIELPTAMRNDAWRVAVSRLPAEWSSVRHPCLAVWGKVDDEAASVTWMVPPEGLEPISRVDLPRFSAEVRSMIEQIAGALDALHAVGVGAFDLSPQHIYSDASLNRCVVLPSPWLAKAETRASAGTISPFIAPEVGGNAEVDPVRADIYSIGALVWYLLIGEPQSTTGMLPSEVNSLLSPWDELIDGCCRSYPARRFASLAALIAALRATTDTPDGHQSSPHKSVEAKHTPARAPAKRVSTSSPFVDTTVHPVDTSAPPVPSNRRVRSILFGAAALVLLFSVWFFSSSGGGLIGTDYVQGYAGTVVRYSDRDYEGASWQKLYAAANLGTLPVVNMRAARLQRILGIDDNNYWVIDEKGIVFSFTEGHWLVAANLPDANRNPLIGLIDNETLLMSGYSSKKRVYLIGRKGVRTITSDTLNWVSSSNLVIPVAPGVSYFNSPYGAHKLVDEKLTKVSPGTQKDSVVVDEYGAPVNINPTIPVTPTHFAFSATLSPGEVYAIWKQHGVRLIEYRDGAWVMLDEIAIPRSEIRTLTSAWISKDDKGKAFVVFGAAGSAILYRQGEGITSHLLNTATAGTRIKLIAVWGTSPDKFWVMDESGSVWERTGDQWRLIIRGMFEENIKFNDAWVSPTGVVFAVTNDALYRLN